MSVADHLNFIPRSLKVESNFMGRSGTKVCLFLFLPMLIQTVLETFIASPDTFWKALTISMIL